MKATKRLNAVCYCCCQQRLTSTNSDTHVTTITKTDAHFSSIAFKHCQCSLLFSYLTTTEENEKKKFKKTFPVTKENRRWHNKEQKVIKNIYMKREKDRKEKFKYKLDY